MLGLLQPVNNSPQLLLMQSASLPGRGRFNEIETHRETVCFVVPLNEIRLPAANVRIHCVMVTCCMA